MSRFFKKIFVFCEKHQRKIIFAIGIAVFLVSVGHSLYFKISTSVDAEAYDSYAWAITIGKGYEAVNSINRPGPGYEFFLALIFYIFGHSYVAVWVIQALLLAVSAVTIFFTTKLVFKNYWHPIMGHIAAALVGFSPDLIVIASMLMTETFLIFSVVTATFFFFKYVDSKKVYFVLLAALFLAIGVLTRGNVLLLLLPILIYFIKEKEWKRGLLFVSIFILLMTPWTVRNYQVYHKFKPFNASAGLIYVGNHAGANGELMMGYPMPPGVDPDKMSQIEFDDSLGAAGVQYIIKHPFDFVGLSLKRASIYFSLSRPTGFWPYLEPRPVAKTITLAMSALYSFIVFIFGTLGIALSWKFYKNSGSKRMKYLFGLLIMMPLSIIFLVVETRYRFSIYPLMAIFAGYGFYYLTNNIKNSRSYLLAVGGVFIANTLVDVSGNFGRIIEKISTFTK